MIVRELKAYIMCPKCDNSFKYSALVLHDPIESVYKRYLRPQLGKCSRCGKANMVVRDASCVIKSSKSKCFITWMCLNCDTTWEQSEYLDKAALASGKTISQIMPKVTCPNIFCLGKTDVIVTSMSKR